MVIEYREGSSVYPAGHEQISGEENPHARSGATFRTPPIKSVSAGCATGGGGPAHGFGHRGSQCAGVLRLSGRKGAHRLGAR